MISEFYQLRRTAIKDIAAYLGFLAGFIGSAPFAWGLLAVQLDGGRFARGLWYFFGIVTTAGIFAGIAGLGVGIAAGIVWEQIHRYRRAGRAHADGVGATKAPTVSLAPENIPGQVHRLQLVTVDPPKLPNLPGRRVTPSGDTNIERFELRDLIFVIIVIGTLGLIAELLLQEHIETWQQWIPLVLLGLGLAATALIRLAPGKRSLMVFQVIMFSYLAAGVAGVYLHLAGNAEFAIERTPELGGLALFWEALKGATPALAPGALAQLGLLGLAYTFRKSASNSTPDTG